MNSASILMNVANPPPAGGQSADAQGGSSDGFTAALASLQDDPTVQQAAEAKPSDETSDKHGDAQDVSALAIIAGLLMQGSASATAAQDTADGDAALSPTDAAACAQTPGPDAMADAVSAATNSQNAPATVAAPGTGTTRGSAKRDAQQAVEAASQSAPGSDGDDAGANERLLLDKLHDALATQPAAATSAGPGGVAGSAANLGNTSANAAPQSVAAAVHLATTLSRDGAVEGSATPSATVHEPVGSPRWAEAIGSRLVLMSMRGQQEGSLTLTPEHLGPLEVQISVNKDTANVWFGAQHADTRAALADAMPRLREMLAASGVALGQSGVSEQTPRRAASDAMPGRSGSASGAPITAVTEVAAPAWRALRSGLIDTYA